MTRQEFSDPSVQEHYQALVEKAGFRRIEERGCLAVTGPDRETFLHSMISNSVLDLPEHGGRYGTFLTPTGKMVSDFYFYKFPDRVLLDLPGHRVLETLEAFNKFIVLDEVELEDVSRERQIFSVQGPGSIAILESHLATKLPEAQGAVLKAAWGGEEILVVRKNWLGQVGFEVWVPTVLGDEFQQSLCRVDGVPDEPCPERVWDTLRIERAIPIFGIDMDETNYPMEADLSEAISLDKGCYVGQEVVSKATHVGGVNRRLYPLRLNCSDPVPSRSKLFFDDRVAGEVTSSTYSPRLDIPIALGYVKRAAVEEGNPLRLVGVCGQEVLAQIVESFLPS